MSKHWIVKTLGGFRVERPDGSVLIFFAVAADSKAYVIQQDITAQYISSASPKELKEEYQYVTGKSIPDKRDPFVF